MPLRYLSPLHKATRRIADHLEPRMAGLGLSNPEAHLISYLGPYGPCPVSRLRAVFGHKGSTLTAMLDRLERRGFITRVVHPEDRRSFLIGLTTRGRRQAGRVQAVIDALEAAIDRGVSERDLAGFRRVLDAVEAAAAVPMTTPDPSPEETS